MHKASFYEITNSLANPCFYWKWSYATLLSNNDCNFTVDVRRDPIILGHPFCAKSVYVTKTFTALADDFDHLSGIFAEVFTCFRVENKELFVHFKACAIKSVYLLPLHSFLSTLACDFCNALFSYCIRIWKLRVALMKYKSIVGIALDRTRLVISGV